MNDNFNVFQTMTTTPRTFPRIDLTDIQNRPVNVASLASSHHLILITLKNTTCPICPQLLKILNMYGLEANVNTFSDPFSDQVWEIDDIRKKFFRLLLKFDAYFIILCPGTNAEVGDIQRVTPFLDYPFIAGEQANTVARALKIQLSEEEFMPAILEVSETLSVDPIYIGRGPGNYFHNFLLKRLLEDRCKLEMKGIICLRDIQETINQLKRKIKKCQEGNMAAPSIASPYKKSLSTRLVLSTSPISRSPPPRPTEEQEEPASPLPTTPNNKSHADSITTTEKKRSLDQLPPEILEIIISSYCDDISSLVKTSRTCRLFYVAVCNVLVLCLRHQMTCLKPALPQENGIVIWDEAEVANQHLDRWAGHPDGIPFRELQRRVSVANEFLLSTIKWTRHWSPRRLRTSTSNRMYK